MNKTGKINGKEFWNRVDRLRNAKGLTLSELQQIIGKTGTYLYVARCHESIPSISLMINIADVLGCTLDYLTGHSIAVQNSDAHNIEILLRYKSDPQFKAVVDAMMGISGNEAASATA